MERSTVFTESLLQRLNADASNPDSLSELRESIVAELKHRDETVGVVGAGLAGAACARSLYDFGCRVDVFEKARGSGGRCSTRRRRDKKGRPLHFDHGAQYFTARGDAFGELIAKGQEENWIAEWNPRIGVYENDTLQSKEPTTERYVGVPKMSTVAGKILGRISPNHSTKITELKRSNSQWKLVSDDNESYGLYDRVVLTPPAPQSHSLLETSNPSFSEEVSEVTMSPVWSTMVSFLEPPEVTYDAVFVNQGPLDWIARNSSKPARPETDCWVLHARPEWSRRNVEESSDAIGEALLSEFREITRCLERNPIYRSSHRWRYARATENRSVGHLSENEDSSVFVCGDWLGGSRVEGAYESGLSAAEAILNTTTSTGKKGQ